MTSGLVGFFFFKDNHAGLITKFFVCVINIEQTQVTIQTVSET